MSDFGVEADLTASGSEAIGGLRRRLGAALVTLLAAVVAGFSSGEPTGITVWDWWLKAAVAALFVVSVSRSPQWAAIVIAAVGAAFLGGSIWLVPAGAALAIAIAASFVPRHARWLVPVAAGLSIQGLLRIPPIEFFGLPSLIAGAAITFAFVCGYVAAPVRLRRLIHWTLLATSVLTVVAATAGGLTLLSAKDDVERGISAARDGLSAARGGDPEAVVDQLESAADALSAAEERVDSLPAQPLRLIPIAAQYRNAITVATRHGSAIARQASRTMVSADISSISMSAGSVDLLALRAMEADLTHTVNLLETGVRELNAAGSPWLISPVASRMRSLIDEMQSVLPEARVAADAARILPGMLGQDAPRRYFVAFGSPAESRELGGFIGSWSLLEFDQGRVSQVDAGRIRDLYDLSRSNGPLVGLDYPNWYISRALPDRWPQNITRSPQLSTVAAGARHLFDGLGGGPIDGFIYMDGYVLAEMLKMTGTLQIDGFGEQITAANAADFFFDGQYRLEDRDDVKSRLSTSFASVFQGMTEVRLPGPEKLGAVFGPVARQGRLQVATFDSEENEFLRSIKLQRRFGLPAETSDSFALVQSNGSVSKLDLYLHRNVNYDVVVDAQGQLTGSVEVELSSEIPTDAPAYVLGRDSPGLNVTYLSLYSPHELTEVRVDGAPAEFFTTQEFGYWRHEVIVEIPSNSTVSVGYELEGQVDPDEAYEVLVWHQPLVNNDSVRISYQGPGAAGAYTIELIEDAIVGFGS